MPYYHAPERHNITTVNANDIFEAYKARNRLKILGIQKPRAERSKTLKEKTAAGAGDRHIKTIAPARELKEIEQQQNQLVLLF